MRKLFLLTALTTLVAGTAFGASRSVTSASTPAIVVPASFGDYIDGLALKSATEQDIVVYAAIAVAQPSAAAAGSVTNIPITNASSVFSAGDKVLIEPGSGLAYEYRTVGSVVSASALTLTGATTAALTTGSKVWKLTPAFTATVATNASDYVAAKVTRDRPGFPLYVTTSSTNATISVTVR